MAFRANNKPAIRWINLIRTIYGTDLYLDVIWDIRDESQTKLNIKRRREWAEKMLKHRGLA